MRLDEHNLIITMEECAETIKDLTMVIQQASKQLRFGRDEVQPGQERANHERLRSEILDVLACIRILQQSQQIEPITEADMDAHFRAKQDKINRMLTISRSQGLIEQSTAESIDSAMRSRGKPCTCDTCNGGSIPCYVESGGKLGELWYCRKAAEKMVS